VKPAPLNFRLARPSAYEAGRAIGPALVEGQLRGGVAQGIGGALLEELGYDEDGQRLAISFMDYRMPTAAGAAIANAARDAPGLAGTVSQLPLTPSQIMRLVYGS
jgi:carbon-monoxide dehydrogenase large subunit/6-hydroxypseudooxynicotine dehydrogenase subunit gamma